MKNSLDLKVRVEVNRVTSARSNQKEGANASAPLSRTDFNGYRVQEEEILPVLVIFTTVIIIIIIIIIIVIIIIIIICCSSSSSSSSRM